MPGSLFIDMSRGVATVTNGLDVDNLVVKAFEQVFGTAGDDRMIGDRHQNILNGGDGNDWIRSGRGADKLDGGAGADTFVFMRTDVTDKTVDWIVGFEVGVDQLDMRDFRGVRTFEADGDTVVQGLVGSNWQDVVRLDGVVVDPAHVGGLLM
jgi:Ca2+-binding RTX toxin-like protein